MSWRVSGLVFENGEIASTMPICGQAWWGIGRQSWRVGVCRDGGAQLLYMRDSDLPPVDRGLVARWGWWPALCVVKQAPLNVLLGDCQSQKLPLRKTRKWQRCLFMAGTELSAKYDQRTLSY